MLRKLLYSYVFDIETQNYVIIQSISLPSISICENCHQCNLTFEYAILIRAMKPSCSMTRFGNVDRSWDINRGECGMLSSDKIVRMAASFIFSSGRIAFVGTCLSISLAVPECA